MPKIDVSDLKKKIIDILEQVGPSLPIPIAKKLGVQPIFAAAILSELLNEKRIKTSSLKVGSSPLYFLPGQEAKLESFVDNLIGVEKEAYLKLKDNKFLEDSAQQPKIRVALRAIKDFAVPTQINGKLCWKYYTISDQKLKTSLEDEGEVAIGERVVGQKIWEDIKKVEDEKEKEKAHLETKEIFKEIAKGIEEQSQERSAEQQKIKEKPVKKESPFRVYIQQKAREKNIEIIEIIKETKNQITARARVNTDLPCIMFALNKKRAEERDIVSAYKKSSEYNLPFVVLAKTDPSKSLLNKSLAFKKLIRFESIE